MTFDLDDKPIDRQHPDASMSRSSIIVTLSAATLAAVFLATLGYQATTSLSIWCESNLFPIEPCMLIAAAGGIVGTIAYSLHRKLFPNDRQIPDAQPTE